MRTLHGAAGELKKRNKRHGKTKESHPQWCALSRWPFSFFYRPSRGQTSARNGWFASRYFRLCVIASPWMGRTRQSTLARFSPVLSTASLSPFLFCDSNGKGKERDDRLKRESPLCRRDGALQPNKYRNLYTAEQKKNLYPISPIFPKRTVCFSEAECHTCDYRFANYAKFRICIYERL